MPLPRTPATPAAPWRGNPPAPREPKSILVPWVATHVLIAAAGYAGMSTGMYSLGLLMTLGMALAEVVLLRGWIKDPWLWLGGRVFQGVVRSLGVVLVTGVVGLAPHGGVVGGLLVAVAAVPAAAGPWLVLKRSTRRAAWWFALEPGTIAVAALLTGPLKLSLDGHLSRASALVYGAEMMLFPMASGMFLAWMFRPVNRPAGWKGVT